MIRVLHVLRTLNVGGAELLALALMEWEAEQDIAVAVSAESGPLAGRIPEGIELRAREPGSFGRLVRQIVRQARAFGADILHAHQRREGLACVIAARICGITAVEHAHTVIPSRAGRLVSYRSARVFAVTDAVARMVIDDFGRDPSAVVVVANVPVAVTANDASARSTSADGRLNVVGVGRVEEQKDPLRFVEVVRALSRETPTKAIWVGGGPMLGEARAASAGLDCEFVGSQTDVASFLVRSDVLLLTSAWEGSPLVVLEALAAGVPVVATAVGGVPALLDGGEAGMLVDPTCSHEAFAQMVRAYLADPAKATRVARGKALVAERHHPDVAFAGVLSAYHALAS